MATQYVEGFVPDPIPEYVEGFVPDPEIVPSSRDIDRTVRDQALAQQEALAQQFIQGEQRGASEKAIERAFGLGRAVVEPFVDIARGIPAIPTAVAEPKRIWPTLQEASRRLGMVPLDIARMITGAAPSIIQRGPLGALVASAVEQVGNLAPRTPGPQEVQQFLESLPLEQELQRERETVAFPGAIPELSESISETIQLAPPIKGATLFKGVSIAKSTPERLLRMAAKPPKQIATRFEAATKNTLPDIFHANPNADKLGTMPIEGFQQTVSQVQKRFGQEIDSALSVQNTPLDAGNRISTRLSAEADRLERAGQPAANIERLRNRALDTQGKITDFDSLRTATTFANRELSPLFTKVREMANPLLAQVDTIANRIIAEEGGNILNKSIESIRGPEGATLRKKWADLTLVEGQASARLNEIINKAPSEVQPSLVGALTSIEGVGGLLALVNGYASGLIPLATSTAKSWIRRSEKLLRDSNSLVTSAYDNLRKNPPPRPPGSPLTDIRTPPTFDEIRNMQIARSIQSPEVPGIVPRGNMAPELQQALVSPLGPVRAPEPSIVPTLSELIAATASRQEAERLAREAAESARYFRSIPSQPF